MLLPLPSEAALFLHRPSPCTTASHSGPSPCLLHLTGDQPFRRRLLSILVLCLLPPPDRPSPLLMQVKPSQAPTQPPLVFPVFPSAEQTPEQRLSAALATKICRSHPPQSALLFFAALRLFPCLVASPDLSLPVASQRRTACRSTCRFTPTNPNSRSRPSPICHRHPTQGSSGSGSAPLHHHQIRPPRTSVSPRPAPSPVLVCIAAGLPLPSSAGVAASSATQPNYRPPSCPVVYSATRSKIPQPVGHPAACRSPCCPPIPTLGSLKFGRDSI